ncbi:MAG: hypothetical protein QM489_05960 [Candidatus Izemoplasma sp.]
MKNKRFIINEKFTKITILALWILIIFAIFSEIFDSVGILKDISYFLLYINGIFIIVLLILSISYFIHISKLYKKSNHYKHTSRSYIDLKNKEKVVFSISEVLKNELGIDCQFNLDSIDHIYFEYKGTAFSILAKEYNGDIIGNEKDIQWKIGFKLRKDNTYFNRITVGNPIIQNQRIIERSYNSEVKNFIVVSDKTDKSPFLRQVVHLDELIKKLNKI